MAGDLVIMNRKKSISCCCILSSSAAIMAEPCALGSFCLSVAMASQTDSNDSCCISALASWRKASIGARPLRLISRRASISLFSTCVCHFSKRKLICSMRDSTMLVSYACVVWTRIAIIVSANCLAALSKFDRYFPSPVNR